MKFNTGNLAPNGKKQKICLMFIHKWKKWNAGILGFKKSVKGYKIRSIHHG